MTRARCPDSTGCVERDGVRVFRERYGDGDPTRLLLPPWMIIHSRCWKAQIPYLARHCRVLTFDHAETGDPIDQGMRGSMRSASSRATRSP